VQQRANPNLIERALTYSRFDPAPEHELASWARVVLATVASIVLCLAVDALLVAMGTRAFPATRGYTHFRFSDYAKLTVIGIVIAGAAWPVVVRLTAAPRWVFVRLAVLVTAALLLPDLYIWHQGQPGDAVFVLVWMHLAIGAITYNMLVRLAPPRVRP
jgi:Family of unknown function (DUF6069)